MTTFTEQQGQEALKRLNFSHGITKKGEVVILNAKGDRAGDEDMALLIDTLNIVYNEDKAKADALVADTIAAAREARRLRNLNKMRQSCKPVG